MDADSNLAGLFYTELDPQQTKLHAPGRASPATDSDVTPLHDLSPHERALVYQRPPATSAEIAFRHRGWLSTRQKVRSAFLRVHLSPARLERFDACGGDCVIEVSDDGQRHRLRANYCGDRWCIPCMRARGFTIRDQLQQLMHGEKSAFTTLTLADDGGSLIDRLDRLLSCFSKLRRQKLWTSSVGAGAYCVQITRGARGDHWHVHLHCLHTGKPFKREVLSDAWRSITRDSFIVDSRHVHDSEQSASYVARYATQACGRDVFTDPEALVEAVIALRGRRMLGTFGKWRNVAFEGQPTDSTVWRRVGRFDHVARAAAARQPWAVGCLRSLGVEIHAGPAGVAFVEVERAELAEADAGPAPPR